MNEFQEDFCFSVSHTTRKPRIGEVDGVNYHFIDKEEFERMLNNEDFIEFNLYSNNYYGTSKQQLESLQIKKKVIIILKYFFRLSYSRLILLELKRLYKVDLRLIT